LIVAVACKTVAEVMGDERGIVGEPAGDVAVHPAALVLQGAGQIPVVERRERLQPALEHAVDQAIVEIDTGLVDFAGPVRDQPRPGDREAVGVEAAVADQIEILAASGCNGRSGVGAVIGASSRCRASWRTCPRCRTAAIGLAALDLVGGGGRAEDEVGAEIAAGN
jgi:hypothetical protein